MTFDSRPPPSRSTRAPRAVGFERSGRHWYLAAADRRDRLSLALWRADLEAPEFVDVGGRIVAIVALWPTDPGGTLRAGALETARVVPWIVSEPLFERLAEIHHTWRLARHDVWSIGTEPGTLTPCPRSLLRLVERHHLALFERLMHDVATLRKRLLAAPIPA